MWVGFNQKAMQKAMALLAHAGYLLGFGYVLVPLVIYLAYDNRDDFIAGHAKQALKAQAVFGVVCAVATGLTFLVIGVFLWPIIAVLGLVWFCCSVYACFKVINGQPYRYPLL